MASLERTIPGDLGPEPSHRSPAGRQPARCCSSPPGERSAAATGLAAMKERGTFRCRRVASRSGPVSWVVTDRCQWPSRSPHLWPCEVPTPGGRFRTSSVAHLLSLSSPSSAGAARPDDVSRRDGAGGQGGRPRSCGEGVLVGKASPGGSAPAVNARFRDQQLVDGSVDGLDADAAFAVAVYLQPPFSQRSAACASSTAAGSRWPTSPMSRTSGPGTSRGARCGRPALALSGRAPL